jgi:tRNA pseudouridine38-40 synthase
MPMRYKVILSYDGSAFAGWQIQPHEQTIQECLQKSLSTLLNENTTVTGAGRTDSKVNAIMYVAHFDSNSSNLDAESLAYKLNAILPQQIKVHGVSEADSEFHARFDAVEREYKYFLHRKKDPFIRQYSWFCGYPLDVAKMNEAASKLLGRHDFKCFQKIGSDNRTSVCTVTEAVWETYTPNHVRMMGYPASEGDYLVFTIKADRFLRNMVRAIVGTLIDIGRGKQEISWIDSLLEGGSRSDAGESVPGHALFLCGIKY